MAQSFKDLFSGHSQDYAKFRPTYPKKLFDYLSSLTQKHQLCWDAGTGNGQAAVELAKYYDKVVATDPSEKQIQSAEKNSKIEYQTAATKVDFISSESVDLVTVAQAFHWFNQEEFFAEVERVIKPGGVLAFWCYELAQITPEIDQAVMKLYQGILGPYWEKERKLVEEGYKNVKLPFEEIQTPKIEMKAEWSFQHLIGYLGTWSALRTYMQKNNRNPIEDVFDELQSTWGDQPTRKVTWELGLRVSIIKK